MPVAFVVEGAGVELDHYKRAMRGIDREDVNAPNPPGVIAHIAGPTETGWRVIDIWDSEQAAQAFYGSAPFQGMLKELPPVSFTPWRLYRLEVERTLRHMD